MRITKRLLAILTVTVTGWFLLGGTAQAAPIGFEIDSAGSSVSVTSSGMGGVDATIALSDSVFSLGVGETESFDFITWTPYSEPGSSSFDVSAFSFDVSAFSFDVTATLAFAEPMGLDTSSSGGGGGLVINGSIIGGGLYWEDGVPKTVTLSDGTVVRVDFQGGISLLPGSSVTTTASVTVISAVGGGSATPMPEPSSAALLGIGGFLVARRLRSKTR